jgi:hypothetical protein
MQRRALRKSSRYSALDSVALGDLVAATDTADSGEETRHARKLSGRKIFKMLSQAPPNVQRGFKPI